MKAKITLQIVFLVLGFSVFLGNVGWGQTCPYVPVAITDTIATCPLDLVQIVGEEPDVDGLLHTQVWTVSTTPTAWTQTSSSQGPFTDPFNLTDTDGFPAHENGTGTPIPEWPMVGVDYAGSSNTSTNSIQYNWPVGGTGSEEQIQQDGWLVIPDAVECIQFSFPQNSAKAAALYLSTNGTVANMVQVLVVSGNAGSSGGSQNWIVPPFLPRFGGTGGFRYSRMRIYMHDALGILDAELQWDIGNGLEVIPRAYFQSVSAYNQVNRVPNGKRERGGEFVYKDALGDLFERNTLHVRGVRMRMDSRFKEDTVLVTRDLPAAGYCQATWSCDSLEVVHVRRREPNAGSQVYQQTWTTTAVSNSSQLDYLAAFGGSFFSLPFHNSGPTGLAGSVPAVGLGAQSSSNVIYQSIQDAWLAVPPDVQCLQFRLGDTPGNTQASSLWAGRDNTSIQFVGEEVAGVQTGGTFCIPPNADTSAGLGWRWIRVRLYTHNNDGDFDSRVKWDIGDGFEYVPSNFLKIANISTIGGPQGLLNFTNVSLQYGIRNDIGTIWVADSTNIPSVSISLNDTLDLDVIVTSVVSCGSNPPPPTFGPGCAATFAADPCNLRPMAMDDFDTTTTNTTLLTTKPLLNDTDLNPSDQPILRITGLVGTGILGTPSVLNDSTIEYIPYSQTDGQDNFDYIVCDDGVPNLCDTATIYIEILPDNDLDRVPDIVDLDDDNDGISDSVENFLARIFSDTDQDNVLDRFDLDSDNDGIPDIVEWGIADPDSNGKVAMDSTGFLLLNDPNGNGWDEDAEMNPNPNSTRNADNDTIYDYLDLDSDNDGLYDIVEESGFGLDTIGAILNFIDANADGWDDFLHLTGKKDYDNDGIPNRIDLDSDNDGIPDLVEVKLGDVDSNGVIDNIVDTSPEDGADDTRMIKSIIDQDQDGLPNYLDLDSDNDGIPDIIEAGILDVSTSGMFSLPLNDPDSNGWQNNIMFDLRFNADSHGHPNFLDLDSDNDGIYDIYEGRNVVSTTGKVSSFSSLPNKGWHPTERITAPATSDSDGILDFLDRDSDNDGIPDVIEAGGEDGIEDGMLDGIVDSQGDGADDNRMKTLPDDHDGDLIPDYRDRDSDNDGITDIIEADSLYTYSNGNGEGDTTGVFKNGWGDNIHLDGKKNSDFVLSGGLDAIPDHLDLDSDNDGIYDLWEALPLLQVDTLDSDTAFDGRVDTIYLDAMGKPNFSVRYADIINSDSDSLPDYLDSDSDNDGLADVFEDRTGMSNLLGVLPNFVDSDSDGAFDNQMFRGRADADAGTESYPIPNFRDLDSDQDGMPDLIEVGYADLSSNGFFTISPANDTNNDGWIDAAVAANGNPDRDGFFNYLDLDSDNDGISDLIEHGGVDPDSIGMVSNLINDTYGVGWDDSLRKTAIIHSDSGSIPDYLDLDSDNDGIYDIVEGGGIFSDSGRVNTTHAPSDRGWDLDERVYLAPNFDNDNFPEYRDLDSDNDGIPDIMEAGGVDIVGDDGMIDNMVDSVADGADDNKMIDSLPNHDLDVYPDYLDPDSDNDGITDVIESNGADTNGDGQDDDSNGIDLNGWPRAGRTTYWQQTDSSISWGQDTIPDHLDIDSDNDGIYDLWEALSPDIAQSFDADGNGRVDFLVLDSAWVSGLPKDSILDTDLDGHRDYRDSDSDNDGLADIFEERIREDNLFGVLLYFEDVDGDGAMDSIARNFQTDSDDDEIPDFRDLDSDNDGIPDLVEASYIDYKSDGRIDSKFYPDNNGDGFVDRAHPGNIDRDGDGYLNQLDLDSDNDGIPDKVEFRGGTEFLREVYGIGDDTDSPRDGWADPLMGWPSIDTDGDGILDFLDHDSDDDGISDLIESKHPASLDTNSDGMVDNFMNWIDGWVGDSIGTLAPHNQDGDFDPGDPKLPWPDYRDSDSDDDGVDDVIEYGYAYEDEGCDNDSLPRWRNSDTCLANVFHGFSPNGDNINDVFVIEGLEYLGNGTTFTVYNRWGAVIFKASDLKEPWDGRCKGGINCNGQIAPAGVYYYTLEVKDKTKFQTGYFYLLK
jgi:gliding motility-associated-like protein